MMHFNMTKQTYCAVMIHENNKANTLLRKILLDLFAVITHFTATSSLF